MSQGSDNNNSDNMMMMLGEIRGDIRHLLKTVESNATKFDGVETRVRALERSKAWLIGAGAAAGAVAATAVKYLTST